MKFTKKTFYVILFAILYGVVAFSSFWHAVEFFELSNTSWMGVILALAFEIGQATVLLSILTSKKDRGKFTPWLLMCILTLVQIIGNVYSSYKYILQNSPQNLRFFKEPIFIWTDLPDDITTVIVTYVSSAILPLTALLLTSMLTNYLEDNAEIQPDVVVTENIKTIENSESTPILGLDNIVEKGPGIPIELTEEEMIDKLKEMNPDLHIGNSQEIDKLKEALENKEKEIRNLKEDIEHEYAKQDFEKDNTINEQISIIDEQNSTIEDLNKQIEDIEHENERISSKKDSIIENLNKKIEDIEYENERVSSEKNSTIEDLSKKLEGKEDELKNLNNYIEDLDRTISVKDSALEEMNKIMKEKNAEITELKNTIEKLRKQEEIIEEPIIEEPKQEEIEEELKEEPKEEIKEEQQITEEIEKSKRSSHFINLTK